MINAAITLTGDPGYGLVAAYSPVWGRIGPSIWLAMTAPTLRTAIKGINRFGQLLTGGHDLELVEKPQLASLRVDPPAITPGAMRFLHETNAAGSLQLLRAMGASAQDLRCIEFKYPRPTYAERYEATFGMPVRFDCPATALCFDPGLLDRLVPGRDESTYAAALSRAEDALLTVGRRKAVVPELRDLLMAQLPKSLAMNEAAEALGISERSLRRQLAYARVNYTDLVRECQQLLAMRLLARGDLSMQELARAVGFASTHTFHRAFRRWTGRTPNGWLEEALQAGFARQLPAPGSEAPTPGRADDASSSPSNVHKPNQTATGSVGEARGSDNRVSALYVRTLVDVLSTVGIELPDDGLAEAWLPMDRVERLIDGALARSADPGLGLAIGCNAGWSRMGVFPMLAMSAPTLRHALTDAIRFGPMLTTRTELRLVEQQGAAAIHIDPACSTANALRFRSEVTVMQLLMLLRLMGARPQQLVGVEFGYPRPSHGERCETACGTPVRFDAPATLIRFDGVLLDQTPPGRNLAMYTTVLARAEAELASLQVQEDVVRSVHELLMARLPRQLTIDEAARLLGTGARNLRLRLAAADAHYATLVRDSRRQRAEELLAAGERSIPTIAAAVGFAKAEDFLHAYRRWTGKTLPGTGAEPDVACSVGQESQSRQTSSPKPTS